MSKGAKEVLIEFGINTRIIFNGVKDETKDTITLALLWADANGIGKKQQEIIFNKSDIDLSEDKNTVYIPRNICENKLII